MPQTILVLAANPRNTPRIRLDEEVREINNGLQRAQRRDDYILKSEFAPRSEEIRRAMLDFEPMIVHFCGHGDVRTGLTFEDESGYAKPVDGDVLAGFFELFADKVKCVVLNACYSQVQAEAIAQHIDYVVGMKYDITDKAAINFAVAFYDALGAGQPIDFAYRLGCNAMQWLGLSENDAPVLLQKYEIEKAIFDVLANTTRYKYRTVEGIAKQSGLAVQTVQRVINANRDKTLRRREPNSDGNIVYFLRSPTA